MGSFLKGKHALVTGSTSGIGLGAARSLAAHGANLTINGLGTETDHKDLLSGLRSEFGVDVRFDGADLSNPASITSMMEGITRDCGGVDILINNAGIQHVSPLADFPTAMYDKIMAINLHSVFHTSRLALPYMSSKKWGRIINIASAHGLVASANKAPYVASKHGVVGMTKAVALETAGTGVTANCINPGWVLTPLVRAQIEAKAQRLNIPFEEAQLDLLKEKHPSLQFVLPEELGNLAVFLCSDYAKQITGTSHSVDGGWTAV